MKLLTAKLLLLALLIAQISADVSPIRILYRRSFESDDHGIAAFNNNNELIGYACGPILDTGYFQDESISLAVNRDSPIDGTIKVGATTHEITFHPPGRDDPSCSSIRNNHMIEVDCLVVLHSTMPLAISPLKNANCFGNRWTAHNLMAGNKIIDPSRSVRAESAPEDLQTMDDRDPDLDPDSQDERSHNTTDHLICTKRKDTAVWGDGDPHQSYLHQQITENLFCGEASSCAASVTRGNTFNIGFTATVTPYKWISAGFNVGSAWTTSEGYSCTGKQDEEICVWHVTVHTDYTVTNDEILSCGGFGGNTDKGDPFVIKSPNTDQKSPGIDHTETGYYCVRSTCRGLGQNYWACGRAGGP